MCEIVWTRKRASASTNNRQTIGMDERMRRKTRGSSGGVVAAGLDDEWPPIQHFIHSTVSRCNTDSIAVRVRLALHQRIWIRGSRVGAYSHVLPDQDVPLAGAALHASCVHPMKLETESMAEVVTRSFAPRGTGLPTHCLSSMLTTSVSRSMRWEKDAGRNFRKKEDLEREIELRVPVFPALEIHTHFAFSLADVSLCISLCNSSVVVL